MVFVFVICLLNSTFRSDPMLTKYMLSWTQSSLAPEPIVKRRRGVTLRDRNTNSRRCRSPAFAFAKASRAAARAKPHSLLRH